MPFALYHSIINHRIANLFRFDDSWGAMRRMEEFDAVIGRAIGFGVVRFSTYMHDHTQVLNPLRHDRSECHQIGDPLSLQEIALRRCIETGLWCNRAEISDHLRRKMACELRRCHYCERLFISGYFLHCFNTTNVCIFIAVCSRRCVPDAIKDVPIDRDRETFPTCIPVVLLPGLCPTLEKLR